jgi:hypothetical protein
MKGAVALVGGGGRGGVVVGVCGGWPVPVLVCAGAAQEFELGLRRLIPYRGSGGLPGLAGARRKLAPFGGPGSLSRAVRLLELLG